MGRNPTTNLNLPNRMRARKQKSGKVYYYYDLGGKPRKEILLARGNVSDAIAEYERIERELTEDEKFAFTQMYEAPLDDDCHKGLFTTMMKGARNRGISVTVTQDDILKLLQDSGMRCAITGIRFNGSKPSTSRMRPWIPSVDRIDAKLGYAIGNIRIVCACVNLALNQFGDEIFLRIAKETVKTHQNRSANALQGTLTD